MNIVSRPWEPQDLLDDLQMYIDEEPDNYLNGRRTTLCMARDFLKEHFREDTKMVEWISVKEGLPENYYQDVLACDARDGCQFIAVMAYNGKWIVPRYKDYEFEITHWMPLPEPPKGEE